MVCNYQQFFLSPFLSTGKIFDFFQISGKTPNTIQLLSIINSVPMIVELYIFIILSDKLS